MAEKNNNPVNIFAILGFALLLIIAVWSAIQVVRFAPRAMEGAGIGSWFKGETKISLKLDKVNFEDGEEFDLKWSLENADGGTVSFIYSCQEGVAFDIFDENSKTYKTLPCNTPYNMPVDTDKLALKVHLNGVRFKEAPIAIVYTDSSSNKIKDIVKISIENKNANMANPDTGNNENGDKQETADNSEQSDAAATSGKEGTITNATKNNSSANNACVSKSFGTPDLKISNLQTGVIGSNGYFIPKTNFSQNETMYIKFKVSNKGTKTTPYWKFQFLLPTKQKQVYTSKYQARISPCSGRYYTISATSLAPGTQKVIINLDPYKAIKELNEYNNTAQTVVNIY